MSFLEDLEVAFGTANLYVILGLQKNCKEDEIKKAYRKKALQVHPDRASEGEKETATKKFQLLGKFVTSSPKFRVSFVCDTYCLRVRAPKQAHAQHTYMRMHTHIHCLCSLSLPRQAAQCVE